MGRSHDRRRSTPNSARRWMRSSVSPEFPGAGVLLGAACQVWSDRTNFRENIKLELNQRRQAGDLPQDSKTSPELFNRPVQARFTTAEYGQFRRPSRRR